MKEEVKAFKQYIINQNGQDYFNEQQYRAFNLKSLIELEQDHYKDFKEVFKMKEELKKEILKYKKGFDIAMTMFDFLDDDSKKEIDKQLKEVGL